MKSPSWLISTRICIVDTSTLTAQGQDRLHCGLSERWTTVILIRQMVLTTDTQDDVLLFSYSQ